MKSLVPAVTIQEINPHPNADRLEIAKVLGYQVIVGKGQFQEGQRVYYIPEQCVLPEAMIEYMGLTGKLYGSSKNRVKIVKLRGEISQGLILAPTYIKHLMDNTPELNSEIIQDLRDCAENNCYAERLGIKKFERKAPTTLLGKNTKTVGNARTISFDVEHLKRNLDAFKEGELVEVTEKIHGTFACFGYLAEQNAHPDFGRKLIFSKGLGKRKIAIDPDAEDNLYAKVARDLKLFDHTTTASLMNLPLLHWAAIERDRDLLVMGEIYGRGVQKKLYYSEEKEFRIFDVCEVTPDGFIFWWSREGVKSLADWLDLEIPTVLYKGPYSKGKIDELTDGLETISGEGRHIREGVVVRSTNGRRRVMKNISEAYLLRKNGSEHN